VLPDSRLWVQVNKINKEGEVKDTTLSVTYSPKYTKEIRLYTSGGDDKITINNTTSPIKLKADRKWKVIRFNVTQSANKVRLYDTKDAKFEGMADRLSKRLSADTMNTHFVHQPVQCMDATGNSGH
jgi:hypothetical protein